MLIPIGAWCRTAYQVGQFIESHHGQKKSYPFDWTIAPFESLKKILHPQFDPSSVLLAEKLGLSKFSSIVDTANSLIFHHDLSENIVADHLKRGPANQAGVPISLLEDPVRIKNARERFHHTYWTLCQSIEEARARGECIGFVRWMRGGHPDGALPEVFSGETIDSLWDVLSGFCGTENVAVLQVISKMTKTPEIPDQDRIITFSTSPHGATATVLERHGWDGDGTNSYRGDSRSWELALARFSSEFNIPA